MRVAATYAGLLAGRRALVTGAAGGIGAAVVAELGAAGAEVVGADLAGRDGPILACDVTAEGDVERVFAAAGAVTDVVHAAGTVSIGPLDEVALAEWRRVLDVNLTGAFLVARTAARALPSGGTLTLISSQAGLRGGALWSAYCASKFGVVGLGQCVAQELAPRRVRVNVLCPGSVETELSWATMAALAERTGSTPDVVRERYERAIPLGRFAAPEEVGRLCVLLASELASYVAGATVVADGGELSG